MAVDPNTTMMLQQLFAQLAGGVPMSGGTQPAAPPSGGVPPQIITPLMAQAGAQAQPGAAAGPIVPLGAGSGAVAQARSNARSHKSDPMADLLGISAPMADLLGISAPMADLLGIGLPQLDGGGGGDPKKKTASRLAQAGMRADARERQKAAPVLAISTRPEIPMYIDKSDPMPESLFKSLVREPNQRFNPSLGNSKSPVEAMREVWNRGKAQYLEDLAPTATMSGRQKREYLSEVAPRGSDRWGKTTLPYANVMNRSYGKSGAKQIAAIMSELYRRNLGGAMAAGDLGEPLKISGEYVDSRDVLALSNNLHGITVNIPVAYEDMAAMDRLNSVPGAGKPNPGDRHWVASRLPQQDDMIREEMIHQYGSKTESKNPINTWSRYVQGSTGDADQYSRGVRPFVESGGRPYMPFLRTQSLRSDDLYYADVEELRAKMVKEAQRQGTHPILHPQGLDAGIQQFLLNIEERYAGEADDNGTVRVTDPRDTDPLHYYAKWLETDPETQESGAKKALSARNREQYMELLRRVFLNWASNETGRTQNGNLGISLPTNRA